MGYVIKVIRLLLTDNAREVLDGLNRPGVPRAELRAVSAVFDALELDDLPVGLTTEPYSADPSIKAVSRSLADPGPPPLWVYWRPGRDLDQRTILDILHG